MSPRICGCRGSPVIALRPLRGGGAVLELRRRAFGVRVLDTFWLEACLWELCGLTWMPSLDPGWKIRAEQNSFCNAAVVTIQHSSSTGNDAADALARCGMRDERYGSEVAHGESASAHDKMIHVQLISPQLADGATITRHILYQQAHAVCMIGWVTTSAAAPAPEIWPVAHVITVQPALCGPLLHESRMDRASFS